MRLRRRQYERHPQRQRRLSRPVISVGNGKLLDDGTRGTLQVKAGDRVIFSSYAGETFKVEERELLLMREDDILAIVEE